MRFSIDGAEFLRDLHPKPFPRCQLIPNLTNFSASQLERKNVNLVVLAECCRTDNDAPESLDRPRNMKLAAVGIHPSQYELFILELNP